MINKNLTNEYIQNIFIYNFNNRTYENINYLEFDISEYKINLFKKYNLEDEHNKEFDDYEFEEYDLNSLIFEIRKQNNYLSNVDYIFNINNKFSLLNYTPEFLYGNKNYEFYFKNDLSIQIPKIAFYIFFKYKYLSEILFNFIKYIIEINTYDIIDSGNKIKIIYIRNEGFYFQIEAYNDIYFDILKKLFSILFDKKLFCNIILKEKINYNFSLKFENEEDKIKDLLSKIYYKKLNENDNIYNNNMNFIIKEYDYFLNNFFITFFIYGNLHNIELESIIKYLNKYLKNKNNYNNNKNNINNFFKEKNCFIYQIQSKEKFHILYNIILIGELNNKNLFLTDILIYIWEIKFKHLLNIHKIFFKNYIFLVFNIKNKNIKPNEIYKNIFMKDYLIKYLNEINNLNEIKFKKIIYNVKENIKLKKNKIKILSKNIFEYFFNNNFEFNQSFDNQNIKIKELKYDIFYIFKNNLFLSILIFNINEYLNNLKIDENETFNFFERKCKILF